MSKNILKINCKKKDFKLNFIYDSQIDHVNNYRSKLKEMGLIGVDENGLGFGNLSYRSRMTSFIITGSQTSGLKKLSRNELVFVENIDYKNKMIIYAGERVPSSESMTHDVIYRLDKSCNYIIHVHSETMWKGMQQDFPVTDEKYEYGSAGLAGEIERLMETGDITDTVVIGGHRPGIFFFGEALEDVFEKIKNHFCDLTGS